MAWLVVRWLDDDIVIHVKFNFILTAHSENSEKLENFVCSAEWRDVGVDAIEKSVWWRCENTEYKIHFSRKKNSHRARTQSFGFWWKSCRMSAGN